MIGPRQALRISIGTPDDMIISGTYIYARGISYNYISKGVSRDTPYITVLHTAHFHEIPVPESRVTMGVLIINL